MDPMITIENLSWVCRGVPQEVIRKNTFVHVVTHDPVSRVSTQKRSSSVPAHADRMTEEMPSQAVKRAEGPSLPGSPCSTSAPASEAFCFDPKTLEEELNSGSSVNGEEDWDTIMTIMIKNLPCRCWKDEVLAAVRHWGFHEMYDFFYLPTRRGLSQNLGYAFINFKEPGMAQRFRDRVHGQHFPARHSPKLLSVLPARLQGAGANARHFSGTRVMCSRASPLFLEGLEGDMELQE